MKFKTIINESDEINYSFKPFYKKIFNVLHKNGIVGKNVKKSYEFIRKNLNLDDNNSSLIAILYDLNYREDGNYGEINQSNWVTPNENDLTEKQKIIGEYFNMSPFLFISDKNNIYSFTPIIKNLYVSSKRWEEVEGIDVFPHDEIREIVYEKIDNGIDEEGLDFFPDSFLYDWVTVDLKMLQYNVNEMVKEEYENYLKKPPNLKDSTKEYMIEVLGGDFLDEYYEIKDTVEENLKDIKELEGEKLILNKKLTKVEKEIRIIDLDLERLTDTIDYGDDEQEYYSMYEEDINELNGKLYRLESVYGEIGNQIGDIEKELADIDSEMVYISDIYDMYHDEERFRDFFFEKRKVILIDQIEEDPAQYAYDSNMSVAEAIDNGLLRLTISIDELIYEYISFSGFISHLYPRNVDFEHDVINYKGEKYTIIFIY